MNKELKKTIESELNLLITDCLNKRNKKSADEISKHIKDASRHIARKFVKHLPEAKTKSQSAAADKKPAKPIVKTAAKKKSAVKKNTTKAKK